MFLALTQDIPLDHVVPLAQYNNRVSIANTGTFALLSNVCPHQNARIATQATQHLKCPYHGMTFDCAGQGINNNLALNTWPVYVNQTMLFDQHVDCVFPVSTQHMTLAEHRQDIVRATPDVIMDVFLDIEHIPVAHDGVYDQIGISNVDEVSWITFNRGSIQFVPSQGTTAALGQDRDLNFAACWMAVYPGTMIEWQPGALFVTVAHSVTSSASEVQVFKYKDTRYPSQTWDLNSAVWETAWAQDRALAELIDTAPTENLPELKQHYWDWRQNAL